MTFEQAFELLTLLAVVLVFWWSHRSFPPDPTADLIQRLTDASDQTQTRLDDVLLAVVTLLQDIRNQQSK